MPFSLTYMSPARGGWSLVRRALLLPESYEIFLGFPACMRHIVLSSLELGISERLSFVPLREADVVSGAYEQHILAAVTEAVPQITYPAKVIYLFFTCMDDLLGTDHDFILAALRERFPELIFAAAHMNPLAADSPNPPPIAILCTIFDLLEKSEHGAALHRAAGGRSVNTIGNNIRVARDSDIRQWLEQNGIRLWHLSDFSSLADFSTMAYAEMNLVLNPVGMKAAKLLEEKFGQKALPTATAYNPADIRSLYKLLAEELRLVLPDLDRMEKAALEALRSAAAKLKGRAVVIDDAATFRPFSMALTLIRAGFRVARIYCSEWLQSEEVPRRQLLACCPDIKILDAGSGERIRDGLPKLPQAVSVGYEAAYYTGACRLVSLAADEGLCGYQALHFLADALVQAAENPVDLERAVKESGLTV